jgi:hypothetical protein
VLERLGVTGDEDELVRWDAVEQLLGYQAAELAAGAGDDDAH